MGKIAQPMASQPEPFRLNNRYIQITWQRAGHFYSLKSGLQIRGFRAFLRANQRPESKLVIKATGQTFLMQTGAESSAVPTFWQSVREAMRGSHQDYTIGSLNRSILLLAIPMVLEMVLESLFAVVDVFWVSRLGANAIAT